VCFFDCCCFCPACFTSSSLNRTDRARARPAPSTLSHVLPSVRKDITTQRQTENVMALVLMKAGLNEWLTNVARALQSDKKGLRHAAADFVITLLASFGMTHHTQLALSCDSSASTIRGEIFGHLFVPTVQMLNSSHRMIVHSWPRSRGCSSHK